MSPIRSFLLRMLTIPLLVAPAWTQEGGTPKLDSGLIVIGGRDCYRASLPPRRLELWGAVSRDSLANSYSGVDGAVYPREDGEQAQRAFDAHYFWGVGDLGVRFSHRTAAIASTPITTDVLGFVLSSLGSEDWSGRFLEIHLGVGSMTTQGQDSSPGLAIGLAAGTTLPVSRNLSLGLKGQVGLIVNVGGNHQRIMYEGAWYDLENRTEASLLFGLLWSF